MEPKFKEGDVAYHKSNSGHKIVILRVRVLRKLFLGVQTYSVGWYDNGYHSGVALECELKEE